MGDRSHSEEGKSPCFQRTDCKDTPNCALFKNQKPLLWISTHVLIVISSIWEMKTVSPLSCPGMHILKKKWQSAAKETISPLPPPQHCPLVISTLWRSLVRDAPPWLDSLSLAPPSSLRLWFVQFFPLPTFRRYRSGQTYCWTLLSVPSPSILWTTKAMKRQIRAGEHDGGDAPEACSEIVGDQSEGHMGPNPGGVLESVNCWRTCWLPLSCCVTLAELHLWQIPASENRTKVASHGYALSASHHFQGCKQSHIKGMRRYLPLSAFMGSEGLLKKID